MSLDDQAVLAARMRRSQLRRRQLGAKAHEQINALLDDGDFEDYPEPEIKLEQNCEKVEDPNDSDGHVFMISNEQTANADPRNLYVDFGSSISWNGKPEWMLDLEHGSAEDCFSSRGYRKSGSVRGTGSALI